MPAPQVNYGNLLKTNVLSRLTVDASRRVPLEKFNLRGSKLLLGPKQKVVVAQMERHTPTGESSESLYVGADGVNGRLLEFSVKRSVLGGLLGRTDMDYPLVLMATYQGTSLSPSLGIRKLNLNMEDMMPTAPRDNDGIPLLPREEDIPGELEELGGAFFDRSFFAYFNAPMGTLHDMIGDGFLERLGILHVLNYRFAPLANLVGEDAEAAIAEGQPEFYNGQP